MRRSWLALSTALAVLTTNAAYSDCGYSDAPQHLFISAQSNCNASPNWRRRLHEQGIDFAAVYTADLLSNLSGGAKTGTVNQGKLEFALDADLEKIWGWSGFKFHINGFYLHNNGRIRRDYVGGINTIAAIEAVPSIRLDELWLEKEFANARTSIRIGQITADTEFFFSKVSTFFINADWPTIAALNLPSGGPAYPLQTPGIRWKFEPAPPVSLLFALFNGDPAGPGSGDEQIRNRHGLNFRVNDPPFAIGEVQYRYNQGANETGLAGTLKFGGWHHFGRFDDRRFSTDGLSLADPASNGVPIQYRGNSGIYAIIDQQIYRLPGGGPDKGISVFVRGSGSPSRQNAISYYADAGIVFDGMIAGRPKDSFGATILYARFSDRLRDLDKDTLIINGSGIVRDYEANLEVSYKARILPGWDIQPTVQRIWNPGGGLHRNSTVVGARSIVQY